MNLNLSRPLAFFDLETTGINIATDKIVQVAILKTFPDGHQEKIDQLINPEMVIPEEVIRIHGISNAMVADKPTFKEFASTLDQFLKNCDLAGYNIIKFDIPLLAEEFLRAGFDFSLADRYFVDVQNIFHKMEPRTLRAAYQFYCNRELIDAHSALADAEATFEVLLAQLDMYKEKDYKDNDEIIPKPVRNEVKALHQFSFYNNSVDLIGHIVFNKQQQEVFNFGKYKGQSVEEVFRKEPSYFDWMMKSQFPLSTKKVIQAIFKRLKNN